MSRILCVAVVVSGALWAGPALAGMSEGVAAVTVGDYPKAISEFQPLAAGGDPAAQYQLAKIYLEGHGPVDGVPQGIDLMTKAANGNYPEAQAQLGLMYAMGLGVPVDNAKAYDWLSKAITALPDGTRRTVAEANRDTVLKRMNASQQAAITTKPAATTATTAAAAATTTKSTTAATTAKPTVTEAAATKPAASTGTSTAKPAATTTTTAAAATASKPAAETTAKPVAETATKTPEATTQVASAKAPEAGSGATTTPTGVRIQLVSMPSEAAAWDAWKRLSGKYSGQLTGLTPLVESADLGTKGTFYRVQTGPFATVAAAQERCTAMKAAGLDCLVVGKP